MNQRVCLSLSLSPSLSVCLSNKLCFSLYIKLFHNLKSKSHVRKKKTGELEGNTGLKLLAFLQRAKCRPVKQAPAPVYSAYKSKSSQNWVFTTCDYQTEIDWEFHMKACYLGRDHPRCDILIRAKAWNHSHWFVIQKVKSGLTISIFKCIILLLHVIIKIIPIV